MSLKPLKRRGRPLIVSESQETESETEKDKFELETELRDFRRLLDGTLKAVIETGADLAESGNYEDSQDLMEVMRELSGLKNVAEKELLAFASEFKRYPTTELMESFKNAGSNEHGSISKELRYYNEITWECGPGYGNRQAYPLIEGEPETEGLTMQTRDSLKCPISQMMLKEPVRNPACSHVYSRDAIRSLFRGDGQVIQCPVAGCQMTTSLRSLTAATDVEDKVNRIEQRIFK